MFDVEKDGVIQLENIIQVLGPAKTKENEELYKSIMDQVDKNGDGEISFEEFKVLML